MTEINNTKVFVNENVIKQVEERFVEADGQLKERVEKIEDEVEQLKDKVDDEEKQIANKMDKFQEHYNFLSKFTVECAKLSSLVWSDRKDFLYIFRFMKFVFGIWKTFIN